VDRQALLWSGVNSPYRDSRFEGNFYINNSGSDENFLFNPTRSSSEEGYFSRGSEESPSPAWPRLSDNTFSQSNSSIFVPPKTKITNSNEAENNAVPSAGGIPPSLINIRYRG
jgi:hypothetical protein